MFTIHQLSTVCVAFGLTVLPPMVRLAEASPPKLPPATKQAQANDSQQNRRSKRFVPPKLKIDRGIPTSGRSHNASRGCQSQQNGPGLTLLVPEYVDSRTNGRGEVIESRYAMALSATPQPVFWAYVAVDEAAEDLSLEFVLRDAEGRKLYHEMLPVPEQSGMVRIAPEAMPPLVAGANYHWFLKQKSRCPGLVGLARESGEAWVRYEPSAVDISGGQDAAETAYWHDVLEAAAGDNQAFAELLDVIGLAGLL